MCSLPLRGETEVSFHFLHAPSPGRLNKKPGQILGISFQGGPQKMGEFFSPPAFLHLFSSNWGKLGGGGFLGGAIRKGFSGHKGGLKPGVTLCSCLSPNEPGRAVPPVFFSVMQTIWALGSEFVPKGGGFLESRFSFCFVQLKNHRGFTWSFFLFFLGGVCGLDACPCMRSRIFQPVQGRLSRNGRHVGAPKTNPSLKPKKRVCRT